MGGRRGAGGRAAVQGAIVATPGKARPYAVVLRFRSVILRSEPVQSVDEGARVLVRLLAETFLD